MKKYSLHSNFLKSYSKLGKKDQSRVHNTLEKFITSDTLAGLREHKVGDWISLSVSMDLRVLIAKNENEYIFTYVDHHDDAYRWGERHKPLIDSSGSFIGFLVTPGYLDLEENKYKNTIERQDILSKEVLNILPDSLCNYLLSCNDELSLLEAISCLAAEYQELILNSLYDNAESDNNANIKSNFCPSNIVIINDDDSFLRSALNLSSEHWRIFLHPKQHLLIQFPPESRILIRGGPGTGKTVALVHRFKRLLDNAFLNKKNFPLFLTYDRTAKSVIVEMIKKLGLTSEYIEKNILSFRDTDISIIHDAAINKRPLLIDEGQDLPEEVIQSICHFSNMGFMISYDSNQSLSPIASNWSNLDALVDSITLRYSYRLTLENLNAANCIREKIWSMYKGERLDKMKDIRSSNMLTSPLSGPEPELHLCKSIEECIDFSVDLYEKLLLQYNQDNCIAIIVGERDQTTITKIQKKLKKISATHSLFTPSLAKGREFFSGIIIDLNDYAQYRLDASPKTFAKTLGLYVAVTRFRDQVFLLSISDTSSLMYR